MLRATYDEISETAETVGEDLGHALEETVGELLDAVGRMWHGEPQDVPALATRAAANVVRRWLAADRHALARVAVAGRRLASLYVTRHSPSPSAREITRSG